MENMTVADSVFEGCAIAIDSGSGNGEAYGAGLSIEIDTDGMIRLFLSREAIRLYYDDWRWNGDDF